jgi:hypothetical protein
MNRARKPSESAVALQPPVQAVLVAFVITEQASIEAM